MEVEALRVLDAEGAGLMELGGPASADRVLCDSFSEDRPAMQIREWSDVEKKMHRGVGSHLIYNQQSEMSWFMGALTSDKLLSVLRLHMGDGAAIASYEVGSVSTKYHPKAKRRFE